jgi:Coenzyme PQQ synthesis protein D (PqqD)
MARPFSTADGGEEHHARSAPLDVAGQRADWEKMMRLMPFPHPKIQCVALDGETVLFDLRTGRSYRLNAAETAIWEQCTGSATLHQIHRAVSAKLQVTIERGHDDVISFIAQCSHDGLLTQAETARK